MVEHWDDKPEIVRSNQAGRDLATEHFVSIWIAFNINTANFM